MTDKERAEQMIILNENGVISAAYIRPWFWEVGDYSLSLSKVFRQELYIARNECQTVLDGLKSDNTAHLGKKADAYIGSLNVDNNIASNLLISSLLQKYANKEWVDHESTGNGGDLKPIKAELCSDPRPDSPGLMQQMFPTPQNPGAVGGAVWNENTCGELYVVKLCLYEVLWTHWANSRAHKDSEKKVDFADTSVFEKIQPRQAKGSSKAVSQTPPE